MKPSNKGIPSNLKEILQDAESFEVYFQDVKFREERVYFKSEYLDFFADKVIKNVEYELKECLLSTLLKDIKKGGEASRCWIPHHGIRAVCNNQIIEIAICFECGWYRGQILDEKFYGTFPSVGESESKIIFDKIIEKDDH